MCLRSQIQGALSVSGIKCVRKKLLLRFPCRASRGLPLDAGDIRLIVIMACVNQNSIWETCSNTNAAPCDDTVLTWLHTQPWVARSRRQFLAWTVYHDDSRPVGVENHPFEIELLPADSRFYNKCILRRPREIATTVVQSRGKVSEWRLNSMRTNRRCQPILCNHWYELRLPNKIVVSHSFLDPNRADYTLLYSKFESNNSSRHWISYLSYILSSSFSFLRAVYGVPAMWFSVITIAYLS